LLKTIEEQSAQVLTAKDVYGGDGSVILVSKDVDSDKNSSPSFVFY
jgi:hypothetical protein